MRRFLEVVEARYLRQLPYILGGLTFCVCCVFLAVSLMYIRQARPTTPPLSETAQVVVFETAECGECDNFRKRIGRPHQGTELALKVPLRYYDVTDSEPPKRYALARGLGAGPTAVVFDIYGREQGRIDWVPPTLEDFQSRLMPHVRRAERDMRAALSK